MGMMSHRSACVWGRIWLAGALFVLPVTGFAGLAPEAKVLSDNDLWQQTLELAAQGDFDGATKSIQSIKSGGKLTEQVRAWLETYNEKQADRRKLDREDFEKYVGYAKARIEREEYWRALDWTLAAVDCATSREEFLTSDWLTSLVDDSLAKAQQYRKESEWKDAYGIYWRLRELHETEPRYKKLSREALTHLRLEGMFEDDNPWEESIEKVRWKDAERAISYIERYYVEQPVDFKPIAEHGLERLLLLVESKSAQETLEGLKNEADRADFKSRIQKRLEMIRAEPRLDRRTCTEHFRRVVKTINGQTVGLPEALVVSQLMRGALEPLDDFTQIIWPSASKEFDKHTRGDFVGVGISIVKNRDDEIEVVTPLDDTPAYRAGIQAGDIITDVDGKSIKGFSTNKVVGTITGPKGTPVLLTIRRDDKNIDFDLVRARVKIQSVKGVRRDPNNEERWDHWLDEDMGIGYIRVKNFQKNTVEDIENTLSQLPGMRGLLLDLRGNPGGLLDSAWNLSSLFLNRGDTVVSTKGVIKDDDHVFVAPSRGAYSDIPLTVLVDERSASASEIVSGAIRDNHRGLVIGERTFGKFSVQNLISLSRSGAKLKITTAKYFLPSGDSLHREPYAETWGVTPDISVRLVNKEKINVFRMQREADLLGPPKQEAEDEDDEDKSDDDGEAKGETVDISEGHASKSKDEAKPSDKEAASESKDGEEPDDKEKADNKDSKDDEESKEDKLPPLKQPDKNNRPKEDAQLDTALLLMRITLIGETQPTLAKAETTGKKETAKP